MSKRKKTKAKNDNSMEWIAFGITLIYSAIMFCIFPGYYTDKLFRIADDKREFFLLFSAIYASLMMFILIFEAIQLIYKIKVENYRMDLTWIKENIFLIILVIAVIASVILAIDRKEAIYGLEGRRLGTLVMVCCLIAYLGVKRYGKFHISIIWSILLGSGFMYLCGILCACKINFLHLQDQLDKPNIYLTPIGNSNFNSAYLSLMLPIIMVLFMLCKDRIYRRIYGIGLYMGFLFSFFLKTESSIIWLLVTLLAEAYFALEKQEWFCQYMQTVLIYVASIVTIALLRFFMPNQLYPFSGLGDFMLSGKMLCLEIGMCLVLWGIFQWKKDNFRLAVLSYRKIIKNIVLAVVILGVLVILAVNSIFANQVDGTMWQSLKIMDATFSDRGYIWIRTIKEYVKLPWQNKIFGNGLNCFYDFIAPSYREEMLAMYGEVYIDPHNELLQVLVTMGALGVVGYFGLILKNFCRAVRAYQKNEQHIITILVIIAYLLQGIVNSATIYTMPLMFIVLGLCGSVTDVQESGK